MSELLDAASDYLKKNARGHVWKEEDGRVDIFALSEGYHNGPECVNCGYSFCHHCQAKPSYKCHMSK